MSQKALVDEITDDDLRVIVERAHTKVLSRAEKARRQLKERMDKEIAEAEANAQLIFGTSP